MIATSLALVRPRRNQRGFRQGVFSEPHTFRTWVRFGGPGPASQPDIDDVGVLSIGIKLMGVPGPKLLNDEKFTQDFTGISTPIFHYAQCYGKCQTWQTYSNTYKNLEEPGKEI
jgi:hypothetical protein